MATLAGVAAWNLGAWSGYEYRTATGENRGNKRKRTALYQLSYTDCAVTGLEPATPRFGDEESVLFATRLIPAAVPVTAYCADNAVTNSTCCIMQQTNFNSNHFSGNRRFRVGGTSAGCCRIRATLACRGYPRHPGLPCPVWSDEAETYATENQVFRHRGTIEIALERT